MKECHGVCLEFEKFQVVPDFLFAYFMMEKIFKKSPLGIAIWPETGKIPYCVLHDDHIGMVVRMWELGSPSGASNPHWSRLHPKKWRFILYRKSQVTVERAFRSHWCSFGAAGVQCC